MASSEVTARVALKDRIWRHLFDIFKGDPIGLFYVWDRDPLQGSIAFDPTGSTQVPTGFAANELSASVDTSDNMRGMFREITGYTWQVILEFPHQVLSEFFDRALLDVGSLIIPAGVDADGNRLPQVTVNLTDIEFSHPPTKDPHNGSKVRYSFQMIPGRI